MLLPPRFFFEVLTQRLAEPDCVARGWLLDGFPHTAEQCEELGRRGISPDKVSQPIEAPGSYHARHATATCSIRHYMPCCSSHVHA